MSTVTLEQASSHLPDLINSLSPGEEIVIADQGQPVARLVRSERTNWPCQAGSAKDKILAMTPDFDAPLEMTGSDALVDSWFELPKNVPTRIVPTKRSRAMYPKPLNIGESDLAAGDLP